MGLSVRNTNRISMKSPVQCQEHMNLPMSGVQPLSLHIIFPHLCFLLKSHLLSANPAKGSLHKVNRK